MSDRHQTRPYPLRMPDELRKQLKEDADTQGRSLNAEIVSRLQESFNDSTDSDLASDVRDLKKKLDDQSELLSLALRALRNPKAFMDSTNDLISKFDHGDKEKNNEK